MEPTRLRPLSAVTLLLIALAPRVAVPAGAIEVFRWSDAQGLVHYSDRPGPNAVRITLSPEARALYRVRRVLDGDTLELSDGRRVRLIGLNAPEIAHRGEPAEPLGPEARRYLQHLLRGKRVHLLPGQQRHDQYGRLLAHVLTESDRNVNLMLLRSGHAHAVLFPPNTRLAARYFAAERRARRAGRGIWHLPRYAVQDAKRAADLRNSFQRLRARVASVESARRYTYLHMRGGLTVALDNRRLAQFRQAGWKPLDLKGRTVVVRGWVRQRDGAPYLLLRHPLQLESLTD